MTPNRRPSKDPAVEAARISAAAAWRVAKITVAFTLIGTIFTGGVAVATAPNEDTSTPDLCPISHPETAESLETYDRMRREGTITITQYRQLAADAIEDQISDEPSKSCSD